ENIYEIIMERLLDKKIKIIVDATKDLLLNVLKYKPFLIKPNHHELGELFNVKIKNDDEIIIYAKKLKEMGAMNVLVSMAGDGAIFITEDNKVIKSDVPKGKLVNSVGAGDSMVGGFIAGYLNKGNLEEAFKMGVATGSASAFSEGLATKDKVYELLKQIL
ncbi:MAG: bifunctional hydroxymethylpyrimidine kinase/phosphomethylpyrimidine kinase, partial [Clostridium sp.]|uniref:1-phosphofructokinase family hexose kinase n=1 Tax=Clostridium sp. TaxID=1506 RepID=UPI0025BA113E